MPGVAAPRTMCVRLHYACNVAVISWAVAAISIILSGTSAVDGPAVPEYIRMSTPDQFVQEKVAVLREAYEEKLPIEVQRIEALWKKLLYVKWEPEAYRLLHRLAYNLHASAGSYGFEQTSQLAKHLAELIGVNVQSETPPAQQERDQISSAVDQLNAMAGDPEHLVRAELEHWGINAACSRGVIYALDHDGELAELLRPHLEHQGFSVQCLTTPEDLRKAIRNSAPVAIIADVVLSQGPMAGIEFVADLRHELVSLPPVLFVSARVDLEARIAAIRAGGQAYFTKPLDLDSFTKRLDKLVTQNISHAARVLVVEDDNEQAAYYALVLQQSGIAAEVVVNPAQLLEKLEGFKPDLVLMDMHLPNCTGPELARMIRQDPRYENLPVVFMSAYTDDEEELDILRDGSDGFLKKPVEPNHLVAVVAGRVRRARETIQRMQFLNKRDPVTGLFNRSYFMRALVHERGQLQVAGNVPALLYLELDDFRGVRDRVGLAAADLLIADVAGILSQLLEPGDIAARFGDASCAVILHGRASADLDGLAASVAQAVAKPVYEISGKSLVVTASVGLVLMDEPGVNADEWVNRAASACEQARRGGAGGVLVQRMREPDELSAVDHTDCLKRLQYALSEDGFYLVFQPIASLRGDRSERYELLLRLHDADGGEVMPAKFLPIATQHGIMEQIDRWVVDEALRRLAERGDKVAIFYAKLSSESMQDDEFVSWLASRLRHHDVSASHLVLELDEAAVADTLSQAAALVNKLKQLGCGVAVEHFGTHLNAAQMLQHLRADFIKIDGSFMHDLASNPGNQATLRGIVSCAVEQDALIIAGFVENAASLNVLWQTGVQYIQGNFLQEPDDMLAFDFSEVFA